MSENADFHGKIRRNLSLAGSDKNAKDAARMLASKKLILEIQEIERRASELLHAHEEAAFENRDNKNYAAALREASKRLQNADADIRALHEELTFRFMVESAPNAMIMVGRDGIIAFINRYAEKLFGYERHELVGRSLELVIPSRYHGKHAATLRNFFHAPQTRAMGAGRELFALKKDGTEVPVEIGLNPVVTVEGTFVVASVIDITARVEAERKLQESELFYRTLFEEATDAIYLADASLKYIDINPAGCHMLGYSRDEFIQLSGKDLVFPEDLPTYNAKLAEMNTGTPISYRRRMRKKDGTEVEVEANGKKLEDGRYIVLARDMSERKKAEQEVTRLNRSLNEFKEAIHKSSIVSRADIRGDIRYVNSNFIAISGYSEEELIGQNHRLINSGFHPQSFWTTMWKTISSGNIWRAEVKNKAKDGSYYWVDTFIMPFIDASGKVHEYLSIRNDITARKRAEEELQQNKVLLEKANAIASIGYWTYTPAAGTTAWSDQSLHILGLPAHFQGGFQEYLHLVHSEDVSIFSQALDRTIKHGTPYDLDHRIVTSGGGVRWIHGEARAILDEHSKISHIIGVVQDITERKVTEEILRKSNERYDILSRATNDAVWDFDLARDTVIWNHAISDVFGYSAGDVEERGSWWSQKIHPDDRTSVAATISQAVSGKKNIWSTQYRFQCADKTYRTVHNRAYILYDGQKNPLRMIGSVQDITARIQSNQEIEKLSLVASKTNNAVTITDPHGYIEWINQSFTDITGYTPDEVKGKTLSFLHGPETDPYTVHKISDLLRQHKPVSEELIHYTKLGRKFWVNLNITPVFEDHGALKNFISIQSDVTNLKEFENSITSIARELASLIEHANVPIFGTDAEGKINEWNTVAAELTGYSKIDIMGALVSAKLLEADAIPAFDYFVREVFKGTPVSNLEFPFLTKSGKRIILLISASPRRNNQEHIVGVIFVAQNITELTEYRRNLEVKVTERTRDLNEALSKERELVDMKSRFVSIASHEFRTPLSTISSATGIIRKHQSKLSASEIDAMLLSIEKQVVHMTYMLDDVLLVEKANAGKLKISTAEIEIVEFMKNLAAEIEKSKGSTHVIKVASTPVAPVISDEKLLRSIFINLLTNAIKFSPQAHRVDVFITTTGSYCIITVQDYGIGIPSDDIKNLFDPFFRGANAGGIQGTGLGLSIIKRSLDLLHGAITVKSEPGQGTVFTVTIPTVYG